MTLIRVDRSTLVLVDYQARLLPAIHRSAEVLDAAMRLADIARELGVRVVGTEQNPAGLGPTAPALLVRCDEVLAKTHFDAGSDGLLASQPAHDVVIAGCESHVCLLQTALGLARAGHTVWAVADACGSRRVADHDLGVQRLRDAGVRIVNVEMVAFEWLRSCTHDRFKAVLALVKSAPL